MRPCISTRNRDQNITRFQTTMHKTVEDCVVFLHVGGVLLQCFVTQIFSSAHQRRLRTSRGHEQVLFDVTLGPAG